MRQRTHKLVLTAKLSKNKPIKWHTKERFAHVAVKPRYSRVSYPTCLTEERKFIKARAAEAANKRAHKEQVMVYRIPTSLYLEAVNLFTSLLLIAQQPEKKHLETARK